MKYADSNSNDFNVSSGVPQGSHLGPTLFLLFINDISDTIGDDIMISLYADDAKLSKIIKSDEDVDRLQNAVSKLRKWCIDNKLDLNIEKCCVVSISSKRNPMLKNYSLFNQPLNRVTKQKDFGVIFDSKLNFNEH